MQLHYATLDSTAPAHFLPGILFKNFFFFPLPKKRMFSSLKLVVSDLRARLGASKVEKVLFLRLNKSSTYQIPGLEKAVRELEAFEGGARCSC